MSSARVAFKAKASQTGNGQGRDRHNKVELLESSLRLMSFVCNFREKKSPKRPLGTGVEGFCWPPRRRFREGEKTLVSLQGCCSPRAHNCCRVQKAGVGSGQVPRHGRAGTWPGRKGCGNPLPIEWTSDIFLSQFCCSTEGSGEVGRCRLFCPLPNSMQSSALFFCGWKGQTPVLICNCGKSQKCGWDFSPCREH